VAEEAHFTKARRRTNNNLLAKDYLSDFIKKNLGQMGKLDTSML